MSDAASSSTPGKGKKRVVLSDDSDAENSNETPNRSRAARKRTKGRVTETPDEDQLDSDPEDTPAKRQKTKAKGKGKANGKSNGHHANGNGHGNVEEEEEEEEEEGEGEEFVEDDEEPAGIPGGIRPEYERGADGYVAGAIVRMKMINFMTYDHVEFRPGPYLNMILGANGVGKSSIAAGIAIGLAFNPRVMGRQDNYHSYVKQGCDDAQIEIELKARPGKKNPVIWVKILKEGNKAFWKLNHEKSTRTAVKAVVTGFGSQANNLCSFLPQDKVSEFAKLLPPQILEETMKSAGDSRLTEWHESLKTDGVKRIKLQEELERTKTSRDTTKAQVEVLAPDVRHFEERESLESQKKILLVLIVASKRCDLLKKLAASKAKKIHLKKEMKKRLDRSGPIKQLYELYKKKLENANKRCKVADDKIKELDSSMRDIWKDTRRTEGGIDVVRREIAGIKTQAERENKTIAALKARKAEAQAILDKPVEDMQAQVAEAAELKKKAMQEAQEAKKDLDDLSRKHNEAQNQMSDWSKSIEAKTKLLESLSSINAQKEVALRRADATVSYVLDWLAQNEDKFTDKVYKPPGISVNVKDRRFADMVESNCSWGQRRTFIVTNNADYNTLLALNRHKLPRGNSPIQLFIAQVSLNESAVNPQKPCSREKLESLGFSGWGSDYIEAEPAVMSFMNDKCGMARLAICIRSNTQIDEDATQSAGINKWVTPTESTTAGRSRYGLQNTFSRTDPVLPARSFNLAVDTEGVDKLQKEIVGIKRFKRDAEQPGEDLRNELKTAKAAMQEARDKVQEYTDQLEKFRRQNATRIAAGDKLRKADEDLRKNKRTDFEAKKAQLKAQFMSILKDKVTLIKEAQTEQERYIGLSAGLAKRKVEALQISADERAIAHKIETTKEDVQDLHTAIDNCSTAIKTATATSHAFSTQFKKLFSELGDARDECAARLPEVESPEDQPDVPPQTSAETLYADLQEVDVKLQLSVGIDPAVVDKYHRLSEQLAALIESVDDQTVKYNMANKMINKTLKSFEPALDDLIAIVNKKFAEAFSLVGCSGEISLNRVEGSFGEWGIHISVSYRNGEPMTLLTGSKQSGGERSLATITYLMSLSSMSRTPFSLVDEINQGMDQRAERNVHNQLVEVTCGGDAGQYFLITPKLLTDLNYHPRMKILNVNNGQWLPDPHSAGTQGKWGDFKGCIKRYRAAKGM